MVELALLAVQAPEAEIGGSVVRLRLQYLLELGVRRGGLAARHQRLGIGALEVLVLRVLSQGLLVGRHGLLDLVILGVGITQQSKPVAVHLVFRNFAEQRDGLLKIALVDVNFRQVVQRGS